MNNQTQKLNDETAFIHAQADLVEAKIRLKSLEALLVDKELGKKAKEFMKKELKGGRN